MHFENVLYTFVGPKTIHTPFLCTQYVHFLHYQMQVKFILCKILFFIYTSTNIVCTKANIVSNYFTQISFMSSDGKVKFYNSSKKE